MNWVLTLALISSGIAGASSAQSLPQASEATLVAQTPGYDFHLDVWANLHDFLYWRAQEDGPRDVGRACIDGRPAGEREGWQAAEDYYRADLAERHWRRDPIMRGTRYTLSGLAPQPDSVVGRVFAYLRGAASVYRACFWPEHETLARARVADLVPLLVRLGPALKQRLEGYYGAEWPISVHVDVVPFASFAGANTASGPDVPPHMQISSIDVDMAGFSGLELLLHEASHEIFGPGRGLVGEGIQRASRELNVDPPRDLWHAVSFYTTGYVMEEITVGAGDGYTAYWDRTGLMARAWPDYEGPIEDHWTPYLRGEVEALEALRNVVSAITR